MRPRNAAAALLLSGLALSCAEHSPKLVCRAKIPLEFRHQPPNLDPPLSANMDETLTPLEFSE